MREQVVKHIVHDDENRRVDVEDVTSTVRSHVADVVYSRTGRFEPHGSGTFRI